MAEHEKAVLAQQLSDLHRRRNGIDKSQVAQILCRVKVGEMGYTLVQDVQHACEWYRDTMIVNIQEQLTREWKAVQ
jgi:hypothetical protein